MGKRVLGAALVVVGILSARDVGAQAPAPPTPEQIAAARSLGTEGIEAAEAGDCVRAVDRLTRAEALYHAPTTLERLGECQISLGKIVAGTESLNRVLRETMPTNPPPAFLAAQARAKKALEAALPKIGQIYVHVDKPADVTVTVHVDGELVSAAMLDVDRPVDPGTHRVDASAPGYRMTESTVTVAPGKKSEVLLKLEVDPNAPAPVVPPPPIAPTVIAPPTDTKPAPAPAPPPEPSSGNPKLPAYIALGVGGVGLAVGTIFGIMALGSKSTLDSACGADKGCPASAQSDIDAIGTRATISTIGFVVGAVGLAAGGVLFFTAGKPTQPNVRAWLTPGSAGVGGSFQ